MCLVVGIQIQPHWVRASSRRHTELLIVFVLNVSCGWHSDSAPESHWVRAQWECHHIWRYIWVPTTLHTITHWVRAKFRRSVKFVIFELLSLAAPGTNRYQVRYKVRDVQMKSSCEKSNDSLDAQLTNRRIKVRDFQTMKRSWYSNEKFVYEFKCPPGCTGNKQENQSSWNSINFLGTQVTNRRIKVHDFRMTPWVHR